VVAQLYTVQVMSGNVVRVLGTGGRHSNSGASLCRLPAPFSLDSSGVVATVFGCTGFLGRYAVVSLDLEREERRENDFFFFFSTCCRVCAALSRRMRRDFETSVWSASSWSF
jgi:hypothetical protein